MMGFIVFICGIGLLLLSVMLTFIFWAWRIIRELENLDKPDKDKAQ